MRQLLICVGICVGLSGITACGPVNPPPDDPGGAPGTRTDCAESMFGSLRDAQLAELDPEARAATIHEVVSADPLFVELSPEQKETVLGETVAMYDQCLTLAGGTTGQTPCKGQTSLPLCRDDVCTNALVCAIDTCCQDTGHGPSFTCKLTQCCDNYAGGSSRLSYACVSP